MKKIQIQNAKKEEIFAIVSDEDYEKISKYKWHLHTKGYAMRIATKADGEKIGKTILMHREIMNFPEMQIDHADGNKLNNTRENLRECTQKENCQNRKARENTSSKYKGVVKVNQKWRARICISGKIHHIGYFETEEAAAKSYNQKAKENFGEFALLNKIEGATI